jgi:urease accessory protein
MDHGFGQSRIEARAESGGYLELFPEPTILHAGSRFHQPVELSAAADGAVVYADVVVPGRLARGEIFEFDRYANVVEGVDPDGLAFRDAVDISGDDELSGPGVFGPYSVLGTLYVLAPDVDAEALSDLLHERVSDVVASATTDATTATSNQTTDAADEQAAASDEEETIDPRKDATHSESPPVVASASTLPRSGVVVRALGSTAPLVTEVLASARDSVRRELVGQPAPGPRRW